MEDAEKIAIDDNLKPYGVFTPADIFSAINADFLGERQCRQFVLESLHSDRAKCPECGSDIAPNLVQSFWEVRRIECGKCGKWFNALTGTFLSGCHFNFQEIVLFAMLISFEVPDKEIARIMRISFESIRLWKLKFKELEKIKP